MNNNNIVDTKSLGEITGYKRPSKIEKCLKQQGIRYFHGKHGPWTTIDLMNAANGLTSLPQTNTEDIL